MKIKWIEKKDDNIYKVSVIIKSFWSGSKSRIIYVSHSGCGLFVYSDSGKWLPPRINEAIKLIVPMVPNKKDLIIFDRF